MELIRITEHNGNSAVSARDLYQKFGKERIPKFRLKIVLHYKRG